MFARGVNGARRRPIALLLLAACGQPTANPSTETSSSSTNEATSAGTPTTGAPDPTTTTAASSTTGEPYPDEPKPCPCAADEVCVETGRYNLAGERVCQPRPPGCSLDAPCSPACASACGENSCTVDRPDAIHCIVELKCECDPGELCMQGSWLDGAFRYCVVPPAGCDPLDPCTAACAQACSDGPKLPYNCDGPAPPEYIYCYGLPYECSQWAQNCPPGEKCVGYYDNNVHDFRATCQPVPEPTAGPGEPCTMTDTPGLDDCERGYVCLGADPMTEAHTCVPICGGDKIDPECPNDDVCVIADDNTIVACLPPCDPLALDCGPAATCAYVAASFVCMLQSSMQGAHLDPCEGATSCDPGLICVNPNVNPACVPDIPCCTPYCDVDMPECPDPGTKCISFGDPNYPKVGLCAAP